jgi:hypothetical protein
MMTYKNGVTSVGTTATLICTVGSAPESDGVLINNAGAANLYLGGSTVTANTASTGGFPVAAGATVTIPTTGAEHLPLHGIVASGTANVGYLFPG